MDDSFFGFDTSVPLDEDVGGGQIAEPSEEEYDALNDETFGSAINGDWEEAHETMVRLTDHFPRNSSRSGDVENRVRGHGDKLLQTSATSSPAMENLRGRRLNALADSDLELNLSGMKLDDVDLGFDDNDSVGSGLNLDPSVWTSNPLKPTSNHHSSTLDEMKMRNAGYQERKNTTSNEMTPNRTVYLRDGFPHSFQQQQQHHLDQSQRMKTDLNAAGGPNHFGLHPPPKICTLEDIERNLIIEQTIRKQQQQQQYQQQQQLQQQQQGHTFFNDILKQLPKTPTPLHQQMHAPQSHAPQPHALQQHAPPPHTPQPHGPQSQQQHLQKQQQQHQQTAPSKGPPGFSNAQVPPPRHSGNFVNNLTQHPLGNLLQQQPGGAAGNRLPPGFPLYPPGLSPHLQQQGAHHQLPPHPLLNQHGLPPNFSHLHQRPLPNPHLPIALNNFAMHPNFNAMRVAAAAAGLHPAALVPPPQQQSRIPPHPPSPAALLNNQQSNSMYNMFNMRLVQEIQQNHPLLQNVSRQPQQQNAACISSHQNNGQQRATGNSGLKLGLHRRDGGPANGNLPHEEFDEYANLMSTRDKHWLIGIQLSQLNTDTPYIDDFYYTVHRERKAAQSGNLRHSQAHKDNQLNHPLIQPKGHAQLILVQLGNKNGTRNGQHRENRNADAASSVVNSGGGNGQEQKLPYVFTPLKFENSLGKLQYGSVTAPRKIIDADIMSAETIANAGEGNNSTGIGVTATSKLNSVLTTSSSGNIGEVAPSAQRKSRYILLHIETLYRIVLKLEDLNNPTAIETIYMKKKKESERIAALEQLENANKTPEERRAEGPTSQTVNPALKNKFAYEIEKKEDLVAKLLAGLSREEVIAMMNVRKGKALIRRVMLYIEDSENRWSVWMAVFASLQNVVKKDKEDTDGVLYALYPEFKKQIRKANFETIVTISASIPLSEKKSNGVFCSKFGISSLVCLILRAEQIYVSGSDETHSDTNKEKWRLFLDQVATSLNRTIQNQTICAAIESDSIQPMMNHFARFKDLKLDSLLALITEAKQQIN